MPGKKAPAVCHVATSLVGTYRSTLDFFAKKEQVMKSYHPTPFSHWIHGANHFNLVSTQTRRVIRFEANRFIVRVEGYAELGMFEETVDIVRTMLTEFSVSELFGVLFSAVRISHERSLPEAREHFNDRFLSRPTLQLIPAPEPMDSSVTLSYEWRANTDLQHIAGQKEAQAPLVMREEVLVGPVNYKEIAQRGWIEFKKDAESEMYRTEHIAPKFGILAQMQFVANRQKKEGLLPLSVLWKVYDWGKERADAVWAQVEG